MPPVPRRYAEVRDDAIHPDFAPGGVAPLLGRRLQQIAATEHDYPESGEMATTALVAGPDAVEAANPDHFTKLGGALHREGHPNFPDIHWPSVTRGLALDRGVRSYMNTADIPPANIMRHWNNGGIPVWMEMIRHARKFVPNADRMDVERAIARVAHEHYLPGQEPLIVAANSPHRYARVPDAEVHEHLRGLRVGSVLQKLAGEHTPGHEPAGHSAIAEAILRGDMSHLNFSALADAIEERNHPLAKAFNWRGAGPKIELDMKVRKTLGDHGINDGTAPYFLTRRHLESNGGLLPDVVYDELRHHAPIGDVWDSLKRVGSNDWERTSAASGGKPDAASDHVHPLPPESEATYYRRRYAMRAPKGGMIDRGVYYPGGEILPDWGAPHKASAVPQGVYTDPRTGAKFRHDAKSKKIVPA